MDVLLYDIDVYVILYGNSLQVITLRAKFSRYIIFLGKIDNEVSVPPATAGPATTLGGFIRRAQRTLLNTPWQIIQVTLFPCVGILNSEGLGRYLEPFKLIP